MGYNSINTDILSGKLLKTSINLRDTTKRICNFTWPLDLKFADLVSGKNKQ